MTDPSDTTTTTDDAAWVDRYRPTSFDELQGNNSSISRLKEWAEGFPDDRTPRLLAGEPGTGKTSTVEVIADWLDLQLLELNASDDRDKAAVAEMAAAIQSTGATGERRLVLLDECDSWSHATNLRPLYDALEAPANLVVATCNDEYNTPDGITNRCEVEEFKLQARSVKAKLKKVAAAEGLDLDDGMLDRLADRPDLRSAINDLQTSQSRWSAGTSPRSA
jgi:replication factor C large subunit